jgi:hypothetical protein
VDRARYGVSQGMRGGRGELRWAAGGLRRQLGCLGVELDQAVEISQGEDSLGGRGWPFSIFFIFPISILYSSYYFKFNSILSACFTNSLIKQSEKKCSNMMRQSKHH